MVTIGFIHMFLILNLACAPDKEVYTITESVSPTPAPPNWDLEDVEFFNCIQFEEMQWGREHTCKILVAFNSTPSPPPSPPSQNQESLPPPPAEGECEFISEQPDNNGGTPHEPSPVNGIDAGHNLFFENDTLKIELIRQDHGEYGIVYALPDCNENNFPFGEVMDLVVTGSDLNAGIPEFRLEDAIAIDVRPNIEIEPDSTGTIDHFVDESWPMTWSLDDAAPALLVSEPVGNMFQMADGGYPKIDCTPSQTGIAIESNELELLYEHTSSPEVMFHRSFKGPESTLPWGKPIWTSTQYQIRGAVNLYSDDTGLN